MRARLYHHRGRDRVTHHGPCPSSRPSRQHTGLLYVSLTSADDGLRPGAATAPTSTPPEVGLLPVCGLCRLFGRLFHRLYNGRGANGTALVALSPNTPKRSVWSHDRLLLQPRPYIGTPPQRTLRRQQPRHTTLS